MADEPQPVFEPLMVCRGCVVEMRLLGIEPDSVTHDLYTFECTGCGRLEVRSARTA